MTEWRTDDNELRDLTIIEDGFGGSWVTHGPGCDMHVVRPGKVQCNCDR